MSDTATTDTEASAPAAGHGHGHGEDHAQAGGAHDDHGEHGHFPEHSYPYVAHHFDTPQQQFDSGKLGIWLFLVTEVLFFAGLFCAYAVYRSMHPEIFVWAHYYLDTNLGALNTGVLILSSLTAAWAVRNAQLKQQKMLVLNIAVTIACALTFMGVKYVEYSHKFHDGLLPGKHFNPHVAVWETPAFQAKHPESAKLAVELHAQAKAKAAPAPAAGAPAVVVPPLTFEGAALKEAMRPLMQAGVVGPDALPELGRPRGSHVFFGVYFFMTGLHGVHVLIGIGVWVWLLIRAMKGQFGPLYFGPIDFAALYWHLVDLIWIYLFPLLYLIH